MTEAEKAFKKEVDECVKLSRFEFLRLTKELREHDSPESQELVRLLERLHGMEAK